MTPLHLVVSTAWRNLDLEIIKHLIKKGAAYTKSLSYSSYMKEVKVLFSSDDNINALFYDKILLEHIYKRVRDYNSISPEISSVEFLVSLRRESKFSNWIFTRASFHERAGKLLIILFKDISVVLKYWHT